jgi:hypothetical protein
MLVFLSHRFESDPTASALALEDILLSLDVFLRPLTAPPIGEDPPCPLVTRVVRGTVSSGQSLASEVKGRIEVCDVLVSLHPKNAGPNPDSPWLEQEEVWALARGLPVIPILLGNKVPNLLHAFGAGLIAILGTNDKDDDWKKQMDGSPRKGRFKLRFNVDLEEFLEVYGHILDLAATGRVDAAPVPRDSDQQSAKPASLPDLMKVHWDSVIIDTEPDKEFLPVVVLRELALCHPVVVELVRSIRQHGLGLGVIPGGVILDPKGRWPTQISPREQTIGTIGMTAAFGLHLYLVLELCLHQGTFLASKPLDPWRQWIIGAQAALEVSHGLFLFPFALLLWVWRDRLEEWGVACWSRRPIALPKMGNYGMRIRQLLASLVPFTITEQGLILGPRAWRPALVALRAMSLSLFFFGLSYLFVLTRRVWVMSPCLKELCPPCLGGELRLDSSGLRHYCEVKVDAGAAWVMDLAQPFHLVQNLTQLCLGLAVLYQVAVAQSLVKPRNAVESWSPWPSSANAMMIFLLVLGSFLFRALTRFLPDVNYPDLEMISQLPYAVMSFGAALMLARLFLMPQIPLLIT